MCSSRAPTGPPTPSSAATPWKRAAARSSACRSRAAGRHLRSSRRAEIRIRPIGRDPAAHHAPSHLFAGASSAVQVAAVRGRPGIARAASLTGLSRVGGRVSRGRGRAGTCRCSWSCRPTPTSRQMTADARFFLAQPAGTGRRRPCERVVLPFPSQEVDPYRGLAPHLEVASARARALHAPRDRHGADRCRVGARAAAAPVRSGRFAARRPVAGARRRDLPAGAWRAARAGRLRAGGSGRRARRVLRARRRPRLLPGQRIAARPARVHRRHRRVHPPVRRRHAAIARSARSRRGQPAARAAARSGSAGRPERARSVGDRSSTTPAGPARDVVGLRDRRRGRARQDARGAVAIERARTRAARGRVAPPYEAIALGVGRRSTRGSPARRRISELALDEAADAPEATQRHVACQSALAYHGRIGDWVQEIRAARDRGDQVLFVAASPGRAERTIELLADYDVRARSVAEADDLQHAAVLVATGRCRAGSICPPPTCSSSPRRISSRRNAGGRAPPVRQPRVHFGFPRPEGRRSRRPRRQRHRPLRRPEKDLGGSPGSKSRSSWNSAMPATTSCSSRSNAWTSCRSTPAAPRRRSTSSAAPRGRRPRRASRRPCATWPKSC